jgi:hypothetical protein
MAITNGYCTRAEFITHWFPPNYTDTTDDLRIDSIITAVSRRIDTECGRHFYQASGVVRYYSPKYTDHLVIHDLLSLTSLVTDEDGDRVYERTWSSTDYDLYPANAAVESQEAPYTWIELPPRGNYTFPVGRRTVKITGNWGYASAVPARITEACLLQSGRIYNRKNTPYGVAGSAEMGQAVVIPKLDPDVYGLIQAFMRVGIPDD